MGSEQSSSNNADNDNRTQNRNARRRQYDTAPPVIIYERTPNPYNYTQSDLPNTTRRNQTLYPNLSNTHDNQRGNITTTTSEQRSGFVHVRTDDIPTYTTTQRSVPLRPTPPRTFTSSEPTASRVGTPTPSSTSTKSSTFNSAAPSAPRVETPTRSATPTRSVTPSAPASSAPSFPRTRSRDRKNGNNIYNCPTCANRYGIEIFCCPNGHSSCENCRMQGVACGLCGLHITDTRNYAMQDFMGQIKAPCPNASDGCTLHMKMIDMDLHILECPFAEMPCPVNVLRGSCRWRGKLSQMLAHFSDLHSAELQGDVDTELVLPNICSETHTLYLVPINSYYFLFHVKVDSLQRCVYMTAQLLGTGVSAAKWIYEVHIYNKREPRRKFTYVAPCTSATIPIADIFNKAECATIPLPYALTFINEGLLTYKFFIKRISDTFHSSKNDNFIDTDRVPNRPNFRGNWRGRRGSHHRTNN